jgi:hypothetical protein
MDTTTEKLETLMEQKRSEKKLSMVPAYIKDIESQLDKKTPPVLVERQLVVNGKVVMGFVYDNAHNVAEAYTIRNGKRVKFELPEEKTVMDRISARVDEVSAAKARIDKMNDRMHSHTKKTVAEPPAKEVEHTARKSGNTFVPRDTQRS